MKISVFLIGCLLTVLATQNSYAGPDEWQQSLLKGDGEKLTQGYGIPILKCTYEVGYGSNYFVSIKVSAYTCPLMIYYNVSANKWSQTMPWN